METSDGGGAYCEMRFYCTDQIMEGGGGGWKYNKKLIYKYFFI